MNPGKLVTEFGRALRAALGADFNERVLSRSFMHVSVPESTVHAVFDWPSLNAVLDRGTVEPAGFRMVRSGATIPPQDYEARTRDLTYIDAHKVGQVLRAGATLIIDSLDRVDPCVRDATDDVMRVLTESASCNLFLTPAGTRALRNHYDEVDTIIVQLRGHKHWVVRGHSIGRPFPTVEYSDDDESLCPPNIKFEGTLRPGDVIHVPRGWWHQVQGGDEASLHLTFAIGRPTGSDWLRWVVRKAAEHAGVREGLARHAGAVGAGEQEEEILAAFVQTARAHGISDFLRAERLHGGGRNRSSLPFTGLDLPIPDDAVVEIAVVQPPESATTDGGGLAVWASDQVYEFPPGSLAVTWRALTQVRRCPINALVAETGLGLPEIKVDVRRLAKAGLVAVVANSVRNLS